MFIYSAVKEVAEKEVSPKESGSSGEQQETSQLTESNVNPLIMKLIDKISNFSYWLLHIILLILLILIMNVLNSLSLVILGFGLKIIVMFIFIFVKFFVIDKVWDNVFQSDKQRLIVIALVVLIVDILCVLSVVNVIEFNLFTASRLILCITVPFLIIVVSIIISQTSVFPIVVIIVAAAASMVLFIVSFWVDLGEWKRDLIIASIIYMIFGLLIIVQMIISNRLSKKSQSDKPDELAKNNVGDQVDGEAAESNIKNKVDKL